MIKTKTQLLASRLIHLFKSHAFTVILSCVAILATSVFVDISTKTVSINDGEKTYLIRSATGDISSALESAGIKNEFEILNTKVSGNRTNVTIAYTFPVHITMGDKTVTVKSVASNVGDILAKAGFNVDEHDMVEPAADTNITETTYIDYTNVEYVNGSYTEAIPYTMETVYSDEHLKGINKTLVEGKEGVKQVNYTSKVVNGVTTETTVDGVVTLSNAVNGKTVIGTGIPKPAVFTTVNKIKTISTLALPYDIELDEQGAPINYSKHMTVQATAYTYTGNNCSTGVAPQPGYIAVNPKVIPYGTKLYIKSSDGRFTYGYAVAADTGGFIKKYPTNIDLFFSTKSECVSFGRRNIEVYILP